mmetsp:Transcript_8926/g.36861  ORF Transcript_8926/g.36861 Transcript_8926/m.36861 type:complete len:244 (-) Transcript_8926:690-1421(-)
MYVTLTASTLEASEPLFKMGNELLASAGPGQPHVLGGSLARRNSELCKGENSSNSHTACNAEHIAVVLHSEPGPSVGAVEEHLPPCQSAGRVQELLRVAAVGLHKECDTIASRSGNTNISLFAHADEGSACLAIVHNWLVAKYRERMSFERESRNPHEYVLTWSAGNSAPRLAYYLHCVLSNDRSADNLSMVQERRRSSNNDICQVEHSWNAEIIQKKQPVVCQHCCEVRTKEGGCVGSYGWK